MGGPAVDHGDDDTYFKFRLSNSHNAVYFHDLMSKGMPPFVEEIQFGYYHHRAIFRFSFSSQTSLPSVRDARARLHALVRSCCFDKLEGLRVLRDGPSLPLRHVYSYCLLTVPNGRSVVESERDELAAAKYSKIYSVRSTTFGLYLPEGRVLLPPRRHYVRISVPSTVVYFDGDEMKPDLFDSLVDAIYYGGLYERAKIDYSNREHEGDSLPIENQWTNDLLLKVFGILTDTTSPNERDTIGVDASIVGLFIALLAILLAVLSIVLG